MTPEEEYARGIRQARESRHRRDAYLQAIARGTDAVDLVRRLTYHAECFTPDEVESIILSETS